MLPQKLTTVPVDETDPARIAALALAALGPHRDTVAAALAAAGLTGVPESPGCCPVARYLLATDPRLTAALVYDTGVRIVWGSGVFARIDMPGPVAAFVVRFDSGHYAWLIATSQPSHPADPGTTAGTEDRP